MQLPEVVLLPPVGPISKSGLKVPPVLVVIAPVDVELVLTGGAAVVPSVAETGVANSTARAGRMTADRLVLRTFAVLRIVDP